MVVVVPVAEEVAVVGDPTVGNKEAMPVPAGTDHVPPPVASARLIVLPPRHMVRGPVIGSGKGLTVNVSVRVQPVLASVNEIASEPETPAAAVTVVPVPTDGKTVAVVVVPLTHVPTPEPVPVTEIAEVPPEQASMLPVNTGGNGLMVNVDEVVQVPPKE